ncbi:hypothetical protein D9M69_547200 [compost metagenome]
MAVSGITVGTEGGWCITQKYRTKKPEMPSVVPIIFTTHSVAKCCPSARCQGVTGRAAGFGREGSVTGALSGEGSATA